MSDGINKSYNRIKNTNKKIIMKQFIKDLFSNPDGSGSTKRTAGQISMLAAFIIIFFIQNHPAYEFSVATLLGLVAGVFGLSSFDYSAYIKKDNENKTPQ